MTQPDKLLIDHVAFEMFQHSSNRQSGRNENLRGLWNAYGENVQNIWRENAENAIRAIESYKVNQ